ncbi:substrate-binding domain-containing protein [Hoeflea sp. G2-23]|uniref:Substrate-binding domain-containing protein n=1 Tax=Hoeflea algicola TaxID=2983763 RepID=A0ABT3Z9U1_9HYPH|nr:substrate-binding domain-containing protein [Hoeflea algicola]MCY0148528.1 substrate-binding domain-containing protein [Hoeflea algicola]
MLFKRIATPLVVALVAGGSFAAAVQAQDKSEFFDQAEYDRQIQLLDAQPMGPEGKPWLQSMMDNYRDTSQYKKEGPWVVCFSQAGIFNPWQVVGNQTMKEELKLHPEIAEFIMTDAEGKDDKQIADINDLLASKRCDVLMVTPNTTAALTPAVERACEELPVIVFSRGVATECPVSYITPIGGYAFGAQAARFVSENLPDGGNVLALRISPGVDVLETRWSAAERVFAENEKIKVIGAEFTNDDRAIAKSIVEDYLQRFGKIDAVWMDAGATSAAAIEAFEDIGADIPIFTGEDQQDFLAKWKEEGLTAIAPTYPTFQWRTAVIAAKMILSGEPVPGPIWYLPQPTITNDNLDKYLQANMPPQHYALCGCEEMDGYPEQWGGSK